MPDFKKLLYDVTDDQQILRITLNAPKGNVLDKQMMTEMMHLLIDQATNPSIKGVVFQGRGEHFSFGASVEEHQKEQVAGMLKTFHKLIRSLIELSKPMFALVRGQCLGGGLELASVCHWIFAHPEARFGQPEVKLAVFPPVASLILPRRIGQAAADELILTGRTVTAEEAHRMGLVHSVSDEPEQALGDFLTEHILPKSRTALDFCVKSARFEMHQAFLTNIDQVEELYVQQLMATEDANEGIQAFLEKRRPVWKNR